MCLGSTIKVPRNKLFYILRKDSWIWKYIWSDWQKPDKITGKNLFLCKLVPSVLRRPVHITSFMKFNNKWVHLRFLWNKFAKITLQCKMYESLFGLFLCVSVLHLLQTEQGRHLQPLAPVSSGKTWNKVKFKETRNQTRTALRHLCCSGRSFSDMSAALNASPLVAS